MKGLIWLGAYVALFAWTSLPAQAEKYRLVFVSPSLYSVVESPLAADPDGNLYGELTPMIAAQNEGSFFELKAAQGYAVQHVLFS